jgi:predicted enzyme involved in methoxymalonyl-ACP biosynthesis
MNRQVERALMAYLLEHAERLGCKKLVGEYIPTPKNTMVRDFYRELGFTLNSKSGDPKQFTLDLNSGEIDWPDVIRREPTAA